MDKLSLEKFFSNESTDSEREQAISFLLNPSNDAIVKSWMKEHWDLINDFVNKDHADDPVARNIWQNIQQKINEQEAVSPVSTSRIPHHVFGRKVKQLTAAAAIIVALLSGIAYYIGFKPGADKSLTTAKETPSSIINDVAPPAAGKAVLTLANGMKILLDSSGDGTIANEGDVNILKKANGEIVYTGAASTAVGYNTLSLPKGSKPVRLVLSDGSMVWLNAASSLTYPTAFTGPDRKVTVTGEAYFEVAKNARMPFYVSHSGILVKVLGTHFNVNTYEDESDVKVTLLEGAVDVSTGTSKRSLHPGQQARFSNDGIKVLSAVDIDEVMAWKNGQFYFAGTNIKTIMRQIEKYYNVEVEYKDDVPYQFVAKISRQVNVSEFLEKLELTNLVHFKIEGRKIIVTE